MGYEPLTEAARQTFEARMLDEHRCVGCGQPLEPRYDKRGHASYARECTACFRQRIQRSSSLGERSFGAGRASVQQEFKRRLGYAPSESSGPDGDPEHQQ
jgi:hypothetical protein